MTRLRVPAGGRGLGVSMSFIATLATAACLVLNPGVGYGRHSKNSKEPLE